MDLKSTFGLHTIPFTREIATDALLACAGRAALSATHFDIVVAPEHRPASCAGAIAITLHTRCVAIVPVSLPCLLTVA